MNYRIIKTKQKKKSSAFRFFKNLSATNWIILVNVLVYISILILIVNEVNFVDYFALKPADILQGKYLWTLISHMFTHVMFLHLFVNMLSLFFIGNFIEKIIGKKRFIPFYLIAGLIAGLASVFLSALIGDSSFFGTSLSMPSVGASGALFAVAGLMMLLIPDLPLYVMFIPIPIKAKFAIPGILIFFAVLSAFSGLPVGNTAHFGGLIVGLIYGIYLRKKYSNKVRMLNKIFIH
ncbi:MAG: rhomboid family intramembrane serine protease [Nanoarchaeota archaeon]|nr:rhomboid family intramembrane serine protease [Nanoarchaeota archaeon]